MWDTVHENKQREAKNKLYSADSVHYLTGQICDSIMKESAIERSYDNLTFVVLAF